MVMTFVAVLAIDEINLFHLDVVSPTNAIGCASGRSGAWTAEGRWSTCRSDCGGSKDVAETAAGRAGDEHGRYGGC